MDEDVPTNDSAVQLQQVLAPETSLSPTAGKSSDPHEPSPLDHQAAMPSSRQQTPVPHEPNPHADHETAMEDVVPPPDAATHSSSESITATEESQHLDHSSSTTIQAASQTTLPPVDTLMTDEAKSPRSRSLDPHRRESLLMSPLTHPNGVSMFPDMTTSEQEEMSREALDEAEGVIVADGDEVRERRESGKEDAGYESDSASAGSTSMESGVRDYMFENGRRYHRFREGTYNFPNDDVEQEREDMKHAMVKLLCSQRLHFAKIGDYPQEVLDIGTGTGIWAIEFGDQYPSSNVLGIDLSPIQPNWLPSNVRFMVDDVESPWLHPRNHFDYIHSRHTVMAIRDWAKLFRRAYEHIRPGGWMELQEIHHSPLSANDSGVVPEDHPVAQYWSLINQGLTALGVDFHAAADGKLAEGMRQAGFVNVTERVLHVPIGTWPKNKVLKTVGLYWRTILMDGIQAIALGPLTRGLHWNRDQVEVFLVDVRRAYNDNQSLMYMPLHLVYGQKPLY